MVKEKCWPASEAHSSICLQPQRPLLCSISITADSAVCFTTIKGNNSFGLQSGSVTLKEWGGGREREGGATCRYNLYLSRTQWLTDSLWFMRQFIRFHGDFFFCNVPHYLQILHGPRWTHVWFVSFMSLTWHLRTADYNSYTLVNTATTTTTKKIRETKCLTTSSPRLVTNWMSV